MNLDHDDRIRAFLADEAVRLTSAAPSLDQAIGRLAPRLRPRSRAQPRGMTLLLAASLLLAAAVGATLAVGSGLVRLPIVNVLPPTEAPAYEAVFLRLEVDGGDRAVIVIGVNGEGNEREISRIPGGWVSLDIGDGFLAPMGAVSTSGLLAMASGETRALQWRIHDLHDPDATPRLVAGFEQDVEQLQSTAYFATDMRPSVFWGPFDRVAIPWYTRRPDTLVDFSVALVDGRTGSATSVAIPSALWILPRWAGDGSAVLLGSGISDQTPRAIARFDGTLAEVDEDAASVPACGGRDRSGAELVAMWDEVARGDVDGTSQPLAAAEDVTFACLAPDDRTLVFNTATGDGSGLVTAWRTLVGSIGPGGGDWTEVEGTFAGWMEVTR